MDGDDRDVELIFFYCLVRFFACWRVFVFYTTAGCWQLAVVPYLGIDVFIRWVERTIDLLAARGRTLP